MKTNRAHHQATYFEIMHVDGAVHFQNFSTREDAEAALVAMKAHYAETEYSRVVERKGRAAKGQPGNIT